MPLVFPKEQESFIRVIQGGLAVNSHFELLKWLQGEIQLYLPHEIMLALWFQPGGNTHLRHDLISALPGIRTGDVPSDAFLKLQRISHGLWTGLGTVPFSMRGEDFGAAHFHETMPGIRSMLVHGISDLRTGQECLYIAFSSSTDFEGVALTAMGNLLPHLDNALRRIDPFVRESRAAPVANIGKSDAFGLSARETAVLQLVRSGKRNTEIGRILSISSYTVKNHLQHIFQKLEVNNRVQAVAKWERAQGTAS